MSAVEEGVVQFRAEHVFTALGDAGIESRIDALRRCRQRLHERGWIGQDPQRYDGAGYGNLSLRLENRPQPEGKRAFVITATQTGGKPSLEPADFCVVEAYRPTDNCVVSRGPSLPSSESMTHGTVYDVAAEALAVIHVHAPILYRNARALGLPMTPADVGYGTPEMTVATRHLHDSGQLQLTRAFAMGGHQDGVIAFGPTLAEAAQMLVSLADRA